MLTMEVAAEKGARSSRRGRRIHVDGLGGVGGLLVLGGGLLAAALGIGFTTSVFGKKKRHEEQSTENGTEGGKEEGRRPSDSHHHQKPLSLQPSPSSSSHNSGKMDDCVEAAASLAEREDELTEDKEQPPIAPHVPVKTDDPTVLQAQDIDNGIDLSETTGDFKTIDQSKATEENLSNNDDVKEKQVADEDVYKEEDQDYHAQDECVKERSLAAIKDEDEGLPEEENREPLYDREMKEKAVDEDDVKVEGLPEEKQSEQGRMKLANEDKVDEGRRPEEEDSEKVSDCTENTSVESQEATDSSSTDSLDEEYCIKSVFDVLTAIKDDRNDAKNDREPMQVKMAGEANAVTNYKRLNLVLALGLLLAIIFLLRVVETYQDLHGSSSL